MEDLGTYLKDAENPDGCVPKFTNAKHTECTAYKCLEKDYTFKAPETLTWIKCLKDCACGLEE